MGNQDLSQNNNPQPPENTDFAGLVIGVAEWQLVKTDVESGEVFEILKGGDDKKTVCTLRVLGLAPAESYAQQYPMIGA